MILRHRRRGSFVNPHWLRRNTRSLDLRVIVPEGPWEDLLRKASGDTANLNFAIVDLRDLHHSVVHAVAEGRVPFDIAVIDSGGSAKFAVAGFLWPLAELSPDWVHDEYEPDVLEPFAEANTFDGSLVAVQAEADVAGLWYRRSVLDELGVSVPWSRRRVRGHRRSDRRRGLPAPVVLPGGSAAGEATTYCLLAMLAANGVSVLDDDAVTWDCAGTVELLRVLRQLVEGGLVATEVVAYPADRPIKLLAAGNAALCFGGSYEAAALQKAAGGNWGRRSLESVRIRSISCSTWPDFDTLAGGMVYVVFRQAANPRWAMQLIASVVAPPALAEMSATHGAAGISPVGDFPRREQLDVPRGDRGDARTGDGSTGDAVVPAVLGATTVDARGGARGRLRPQEAASRTAEMIGAITGLCDPHLRSRTKPGRFDLIDHSRVTIRGDQQQGKVALRSRREPTSNRLPSPSPNYLVQHSIDRGQPLRVGHGQRLCVGCAGHRAVHRVPAPLPDRQRVGSASPRSRRADLRSGVKA